jgi:hypothetical protein
LRKHHHVGHLLLDDVAVAFIDQEFIGVMDQSRFAHDLAEAVEEWAGCGQGRLRGHGERIH